MNATVESNWCLQMGLSNTGLIGSEDCLYLTVYSPYTDFQEVKSNLPVMVGILIFARDQSNNDAIYLSGILSWWSVSIC